MVRTLVYLASPYSDPDPDVMRQRFEAVNLRAAIMMVEGHHVFSPISHTHPIAIAGSLPTGWAFWEAYDRAILSCCCRLVVLCQDGWRESEGVKTEIKIATELGLTVEYIDA